jgi:phage-related protein
VREIRFYRTASGRSPIQDFLDSLTAKAAQKVAWVLRLVEELDPVPRQYFKKLRDTDNLWEVRAQHGDSICRLLGFFDGPRLVVLTNGLAKKSKKIPRREIALARERRLDYLEQETRP